MGEESPKSLADRLIEAENAEDLESSPVAKTAIDPSFEHMLEEERKFEARVRRVAVLSWAVTLVCLVASVASIHIIRYSASASPTIDMARSVLMVFGILGVISLLAAALTSITWLFRSRTPTLKAIERRLGALEKLLMNQNPRAR